MHRVARHRPHGPFASVRSRTYLRMLGNYASALSPPSISGIWTYGRLTGEVHSPMRFSTNLPWGPAKRAPAQKMQMQMKDGLPSAFTVVQHRAVAAEKIQFARQFRGYEL